MMNELTLLEQLIAYPSVTPNDMKCQEAMIGFLASLGFTCERLDKAPVANFYASYGNSEGPLLIFAGHTDVVSAGESAMWHTDPFKLAVEGDMLYGRGVADMKGSLACMLLAAAQFVRENPNPEGRLGFLITSGEEGDHFDCGTPYVMDVLAKRHELPEYCVVGEPSSTAHVGDVVKIGRRGSLTGSLVVRGTQGHVAYPHLADNPIHKVSAALAALTAKVWDNGNDYFPPTTLQVTKIESGGLGGNVIPGDLTLQWNVRYSTEQSHQGLIEVISSCFETHGIHDEITWRHNGEPFVTTSGKLLDATVKAVKQFTHKTPELRTSGGTSDGRFIAPYGVEVIELGPVNQTIHQVNECVSHGDLKMLTGMYYEIARQLLA